MDPNAFITEVCRRWSSLHPSPSIAFDDISQSPMVRNAMETFRCLLPTDRTARILDIGVGTGWFLAACIELGYTNLYGADWGVDGQQHIRSWSRHIRELYEIGTSIGDFLSHQKDAYDCIHLSHVIEHIPKYSLLYAVDALYYALKTNGMLIVLTPNMEGPCALSCQYVTVDHEYGFSGSNLRVLLRICGFEDIILIPFKSKVVSIKQLCGAVIRKPFLYMNWLKHRLFGVNAGRVYGTDLVAVGYRRCKPALFSDKYK